MFIQEQGDTAVSQAKTDRMITALIGRELFVLCNFPILSF